MQWICSRDVAVRSALNGSGGAATEWTIDNALGSEPKLPAWGEIANHIIPGEPGRLLAGQGSPEQCMAAIKGRAGRLAAPFRKG
jgi:hypothetical protein